MNQNPKDTLQLKDKAIKSAESVAAIRAFGVYDVEAKNPDHLSSNFLGIKFRIRLWSFKYFSKLIKRKLENLYPGLYWYFQVRTKHIDSLLVKAIDVGIEQLVILGAGYDTRPYRFQEKLADVSIFEVDFPGTQNFKINKLKKLYGSLPEHVVYVPIDFNTQSIETELTIKGYDPTKKTFFIWEGVSYYLPEKSVNRVLKFVKNNMSPDSSIVFDYVLRSFIDGDYSSYGSKILSESWEKAGEPGLFGIEDIAINHFLNKRGLKIISDIGPKELECSYATGQNGKQYGRVWGCMRISQASVCNKK